MSVEKSKLEAHLFISDIGFAYVVEKYKSPIWSRKV